MDAMRDDFKNRYKIDAYSTVKSKLRLRAECEKAKKTMSGNTQAIPISLESFVDDKDVSGKISRADFEVLAKPLLDRIRSTLINLLKEARKYEASTRDSLIDSPAFQKSHRKILSPWKSSVVPPVFHASNKSFRMFFVRLR